jgi:hypothetical protein
MRRLYTWFLGMAGGAAAYRAFRRRPFPAGDPSVGRADELRTKLAEARDAGDDRASFEAGETPVDQADVPAGDDPDARRRSVHREARAAIDEMQAD